MQCKKNNHILPFWWCWLIPKVFCPKQAALGGLSVKPLKINKHITTHSSVQCRDQFNYSQACPLELNVALGLCLELKSIENWVCFGRHPQRGQQLKDLICLLKVTPKTTLNTKFSIHGQRSTSMRLWSNQYRVYKGLKYCAVLQPVSLYMLSI